jgi:hypothetical protein
MSGSHIWYTNLMVLNQTVFIFSLLILFNCYIILFVLSKLYIFIKFNQVNYLNLLFFFPYLKTLASSKRLKNYWWKKFGPATGGQPIQWLTDNLLEMFYTIIKIKSKDNTITIYEHCGAIIFHLLMTILQRGKTHLISRLKFLTPLQVSLSLISNPFIFCIYSVEAFCRTICKQWIFLLFFLLKFDVTEIQPYFN